MLIPAFRLMYWIGGKFMQLIFQTSPELREENCVNLLPLHPPKEFSPLQILILTPLQNRLTEKHAHTITKIAINSKLFAHDLNQDQVQD